MTKLVLIRGLPGASKSTTANNVYVPQGYKHFEADMYFINESGVYNFDAAKIGKAHGWCKYSTEQCLKNGQDVVVSNTFTQLWEMKEYIDMASKYGVELEVIHCTGKYKNVHGVPDAALEKMRKRWQAYPGEKTV